MEHTFSRTELLIGEEGLGRLQGATVLVFGVGGVGSYAVEGLARAGIGHLILVDFDVVSVSNINRQLPALHSTIGQPKVEIMKKRLLDINPELVIEVYREIYSAEKADEFLGRQLDYVVDAIDMVTSKVSLAKECIQRGIPLVSSMGAGNRLTALNYRVADISQTTGCPLAKSMRKLLRAEGITKGLKVVYSPDAPVKRDEEPRPMNKAAENRQQPLSSVMETGINKRQVPGSISFVPSVVGLLLAGEVVRDLLGLVGQE